MVKALEGTRILECGRGFAVGLVGTMFGDMGAEVIRYEEPGTGDPLRYAYPPLIKGIGAEFLWSARNKKSITLRLETGQGQEIFKRLVEISDVVTENFAPGTMGGWGLSYENLKRINPGIIMLSITPYGQRGPYVHRPATDETLQAHSGLMSISGDPDGPAVLYGVPIVDIMGGFQGIYAALSALFYKGISGQGQWIDISLFEAAAYCQEYKLLHYTKLGELFWRVGSRWVPMCRSYTAKDGDVFIMSGAGLRGAIIFEVIGREDVLKDPRWPENPFKPLDEDVLLEFDAIIDEWVKSKTVSEIVDICVSRKVIAAPVCNVAQMVNDPQYIARNALVEVDHPVAGKLKFQGIAANLSLTPGRVDTPAPLLGEHNNYVYGNLLKYSKEEISKMSENGVI